MEGITGIIPYVPAQDQVENATEQEFDAGDDQSAYEAVFPQGA
jgi:hypothetical protein